MIKILLTFLCVFLCFIFVNSQNKIKGVFVESVGYTIVKLKLDTANSYFHLEDIIFIDSLKKAKYNVVFYRMKFLAFKSLSKFVSQKLNSYADSLFLFNRGYKNNFIGESLYHSKMKGIFLTDSLNDIYLVTKSNIKAYKIIKASKEMNLSYFTNYLCPGNIRRNLLPIYIFDNTKLLEIRPDEINKMNFRKTDLEEINFEVCW